MKKKIKQWTLGKLAIKRFQPFFEQLHWLALKGMNYGSANSPLDSGEASMLDELVNELPENPVIFDVGANCGQYTDLLIEKLSKKNLSIHLFEPNYVCYEILIKKYDGNEKLIINNCALGEEMGTGKLYSDNNTAVNATLVDTEAGGFGVKEVRIQTIDQYCNTMNIEKIDFLKIDTEGFEINVLKGAKEMIRKAAINSIQLEHGSLHSIVMGASLYMYSQILAGYEAYHIKQDGLYKLKITPMNEIYYNSNYFFKRKINA